MPATPSGATAKESPPDGEDWACARAWARSGVVALCGDPSGPPLLPPLGAATRMDGVAAEISRRSAARGHPVRVGWEAALAGRASLLGLTRHGRTSANGSCRLLSTADVDVALNMPRADDLSLVPALTSDRRAEERPWEAVAAMAAGIPAADFVARARLLGLAASVAGERWAGPRSADGPDDGHRAQPYTASPRGEAMPQGHRARLRVVDLSALWAGPIAARVLCEAGAEVIKVEDVGRPDAARRRPEFYSWIHSRTETTERVDLTSAGGRERLRELIQAADVVIESSRPRALEQISLGPDRVEPAPGQVWLSITGHGRTGPAREWTGFGDDSAVAGGFLCRGRDGSPRFCGDAIADPVAGLVGALAVLRCLDEGGGQLLDVSLAAAAAWSAGRGPHEQGFGVEPSGRGWVLRHDEVTEPIATAPPTLDWIVPST